MDRNCFIVVPFDHISMSLPARGAWIEIFDAPELEKKDFVAPREGSVDRNTLSASISLSIVMSLPARGAWIEILTCTVTRLT